MSPSAAQINELYTGLLNQHVQGVQQGKGSAEITDALSLEQILSDDYSFEIAGQEFDLAGRGQGIPAVKEYIATRLFPAILSIYDTNKPMAWEVVRVIGGGESPWATAEIRGTATSKKSGFLLYLNSRTLI
jgi:hypothetical protein